ncbi:MAG: hypothetical protein GX167_06910 [Firmicutes bacterium]|jgi:hypothetical protein|nr:hypothetical protein [Bacillota bacterium]
MKFDKKRSDGSFSYLIRIQRTQNSTWQGTVHWLEGEKTRQFRSLLELLHLLQEAQQTLPQLEEDKLRSWSDDDASRRSLPNR